MKNFCVLALTAALANGMIDCAVDTQTSLDVDGITVLPPLLPITLEDCEALPDWAAAFLDSGANFKWTRVMAKTSDGYDQNLW